MTREQKGYKPYFTMKKGALVMMSAYKKGYGSDLLQKKQQDKEIAWKDIPPKDRHFYEMQCRTSGTSGWTTTV